MERDHPREYGENLNCLNIRIDPSWIIPANTGRMPRRPRGSSTHGDHPREYGENTVPILCLPQRGGSSPRIRGESSRRGSSNRACGIIPANTGRIRPSQSFPCCPWDHPREYGENKLAGEGQDINAGSSPRIRGEFGAQTEYPPAVGIIPANTGRIATF